MRTVVRKKSRILLFTFLVVLFLFATGGSAKLTQTPQMDRSRKSDAAKPVQEIDEVAELRRALSSTDIATVIVELQGEPVVVHQKKLVAAENPDQKLDLNTPQVAAYESQLAAEQENFKALARKLSPNLRVIAELRTLLNAISIEAPGTDLAAIATLPGVKRVVLRKQYRAVLNTSVPLINAPAAWTKVGGSGSAGQGIRIAILDTGIDQTNPLFADAGFTAPAGFPRGNLLFTNQKVIVARAYLPGNGATPLDQNGHGTSAAGIAAGDFNTTSPLTQISGVAPRAFLGNYRVLDSGGIGVEDLIIQGLQEALADGFDVANLSFGVPATSSLGLLDQAVENAVAAGMTVVTAAGNSGEDGSGTIESPGIAPSAITVGSSSNSHVVGPGGTITVSGLPTIGAPAGQKGAASSALSSTIGPAVYVDVSTLDTGNRGCMGLPAGSLSGKIALIESGNCGFAFKIANASSAGASAVIVYNKPVSEGADGGDTVIIMNVSGPPMATIPSLFVSRTNGQALVAWLVSHPGAQATLSPVLPLIDVSSPADVISSFSSRGPSSLRGLKPDLVAPGENIYSGAITTTNPGGVSDPSRFALASGTSQAAPHVAGAAALLKQLHPTWTPLQIKSALISSANNAVFTDSSKTVNAGVLDDGSGRADLSLASSVNATFSPASLSYGYVSVGAQALQVSKDLQITNQSGGPNTYTISFQNLSPGTGISPTASAGSVSPAAGQSTSVTITLTVAGSAATGDRTGYVVITDQGNQVLRVPYWVRIVPAPSVQFNSSVFSVSEQRPSDGAIARVASIVATRSGESSTTVSVDYATSDGTASQRTDYTTASGTIAFAPGQTTRSFTIPIIEDGYVEQPETVNLTLSNAIGANLGSPNQAVLTIDDDEKQDATTNPLDDADQKFFVRQHYFDFLSRTPDSGGFDFWLSQITGPPACGNAACLLQRRITVSNAFFFELEFQQTGAFVFRLYRAAYGNNQPFPNPDPNPNFPGEAKKLPSYQVFSRDRAKVIGGSNLAQKQLDLANLFVSRDEFLLKYPASLNTADLFVDAVLAQIQTDLGVNLTSERAGLITLYNSGGRGAVLYRLADDNVQTNPINNRSLIDAEYNRAFVATQYFGYLRRNPDIAGIIFWLSQVNSAPLRDLAKQNAMVCSFITSGEYQFRFAPVAPHSNTECPQ
jgi:minor extracellular serine protease Vpr